MLDGGQLITTVNIDQSQSPSGSGWQSLGTFFITGDTLVVQIAHPDYYPYYYYSSVADAVEVQQVQGNGGADDDFHVATGSPTIDACDPTLSAVGEPTPNGGRINLGSDGGTAYATKSPQTLVQVLSPAALRNLSWARPSTSSGGATASVPSSRCS